MFADLSQYIKQANKIKLSKEHYWHLLLHMKNGSSEIDDENFFIAKDGKNNAKLELEATITALLSESRFDDNATACKFPARKEWLIKKLNLKNLPKIECKKYNQIINKLNPTSATVVFPSAHINSPASMFGHTFLRINSKYDSKLLSYAVNYAANADQSKTNGLIFAITGLTGGYHGLYSMLPYYEKLKEYRDSEQRDIWEYDLNLSQVEVMRMFKHIWELNGIYSDYYFFTENCSYNILWLLEIARANIHLRDYFTYQVSPLETIHAMKDEGLIVKEYFRDSKRRVLLKYEDAINSNYLPYVKALLSTKIKPLEILNNSKIPIQQKRFILEASIELLEYQFIKAVITKKQYLSIFHTLTTARATLGKGKAISDFIPVSPMLAHRQARVSMGIQSYASNESLLLGVRPVYHDIEDSNKGLLRGTQIEFLNTLVKIDKNKIKIEKLTLLSISSFSQISEFIKPFSWRTHFQWDRDYLDDNLIFNASVGAGASWGNEYGYTYILVEGLSYFTEGIVGGVNLSTGFVLDNSEHFKTNFEINQRWYTNGNRQLLLNVVQSYAPTQNTQVKFKYQYKQKVGDLLDENKYSLLFNYYF